MASRFLRPATLVVAVVLLAACGPATPTATPRAASPGPSASTPGATPSGSSTSGPTSAPPASGPFDPAAVAVSLERVASGMDTPLAVTNAGDGSGRIFVAEQSGAIRIVRDGALVDQPFLDISDRITSGGERGLLGLAFHPKYPEDPRFFVDYTDGNGDTQVSSFTVDPGNPDRADPGSEVKILFVTQPYANHNGGAVAFGPDGDLYISLGDGGSGGDPHGNGQSLTTALGKLLRIDIDRTEGDHRYAVPADNPFVDEGTPEIFVYGLRNPWRMSFDRLNGDLWIGDVGQGDWEEVDVVRAGTSGQNFGWNRMEGAHCFRPATGCEGDGLVLPVAEYSHDSGCTVIGGVVYRGSQQAALVGGYLFADYCSGIIWAIDPAVDGAREPTVVSDTDATISSFGEDEAGEVYATDLSSGELLRVVGTAR
jgi:glucose/arabinose dehydrogenase